MKLPRVAGSGIGFLIILACIGCGNTFRPVANPITSVTGTPQQQRLALVVFQGEDLANPGKCLPPNPLNQVPPFCQGATSQIDVSGDTDVADVYVGYTPVFGVIGSQIAVANNGGSTVSVFPTLNAGTTPTTLTLPGNTGSSNAGPTSAITAGSNGYFYVADPGSNQVSVLSTSVTIATVPLGASPVALAATPDGKKVYVATKATSNNISVISTVDNTITTTLTAGSNPVYVAATDSTKNEMYVLDGVSNSIAIFNALTDTLTGTLTLPPGGNPNYMTFDPSLQRLYVANPSNGSVSIFDATTNSQTPLATLTGLQFPTFSTLPTPVTIPNPPTLGAPGQWLACLCACHDCQL